MVKRSNDTKSRMNVDLFSDIKIVDDGCYLKLPNLNSDKYRTYDPEYIVTGMIKTRRRKINELWKVFRGTQDNDFLNQYKYDKNFSSRMWEMYIGVILLNNGCKINAKNNSHLDFFVNDSFYIECVYPQNANCQDKPDYVKPLLRKNNITERPEESFKTRITSSIADKYRKYREKLENGSVNENVPYVLAINTAFRDMPDGIVHSLLFGYGNTQILYQRDKSDFGTKVVAYDKESISYILKSFCKKVTIGYFENNEFDGISAVICCNNHIINSSKEPGADCYIIRNPYAKNVLCNQINFISEIYREDNFDGIFW
ncbi:MAG: hypothetical protein QY312_03285 [Candidatus Dojkabacteria bacterium]|nr:MAG: hypothetical protein QY312_03285 [Candidatus Dojkabacteria bacterium]